GLAHDDLRARIGARAVPGEHILLVGARDLDPGERENLKRAEVQVVSADAWRDVGPAALAAPLDRLAARVRDVYLHVDVDVVDPEEAPGVSYPTPRGLAPADVEAWLVEVGRRFRVRAAALTAFNPDRDEGDRTLRVGLRLLSALAGAERAVE
ncbi:MAG: arginase family protein, partial [Gemmatimonadota bacterium]